jgi:superfamily I DNA/RNA helicase
MDPQLPYDYILFDEAQDASPAMLDIFLKQKAVKVMVGDTHQQIYGWRYAVNSLEKARFKSFKLSTSFRFGTNIAHLAKEILQWKKHTAGALDVAIAGFGVNKKHRSKATIARTNLGLLLKAIEYITEHEDVKHIYFEGNINSYTYADEGTSLYDVLSLYNDKRSMIKDKLVGAMNNLEELEEYIEKTEDVQLGMMVEIVREYGNEIPGILKSLREKHTGDEEKQKAEMIFSTVHRCKGMEYDDIELVNDFITESRLERLAADPKERETMNLARLNEEINLLYVAVTRTKSTIHIPETLLPKDFPVAPDIQVVKVKKENKESKEKAYTFEKKRESYKEAYQPWTAELDMELEEMHAKGFDVFELAEYFQRANSAIMSRLRKLGLI